MPAEPAFERVALVVHPSRPVANAVATLTGWTQERGLDLVQLAAGTHADQRFAAPGDVGAGDLVVAVGGDGTVLRALHAARPVDAPVLGVACGSLGALSAIPAEQIVDALERVMAGDWTPRSLPVLAIADNEAAAYWAVNDFVVVRRGAGQLVAAVSVDDDPYVRLAGDGVIVATALGSSAYSMAAGGPLLASATPAFVCTPLAMHGGSAPPLVVPAEATLTVDVQPGYGGFEVEIDGRRSTPAADRFRITLNPDGPTLVTFGAAGRGLAGLRRRGLIADSPRVLARDDRAATVSRGPV